MNVISFVFLGSLLVVHGNKEIDGKATKEMNDNVPEASNTQGKVTCIIMHPHSLKIRKYFPLKHRELFLSEVNDRETIAAIEANNDTYCLQKRIEKFLLYTCAKFVKFRVLQNNSSSTINLPLKRFQNRSSQNF